MKYPGYMFLLVKMERLREVLALKVCSAPPAVHSKAPPGKLPPVETSTIYLWAIQCSWNLSPKKLFLVITEWGIMH
jgi:hypothetical protein